jgi:hypothetical protein
MNHQYYIDNILNSDVRKMSNNFKIHETKEVEFQSFICI